MHDFIVIGAGYGGLSAAALLSQSGKDILLVESHSKIAGCASYFKRKGFTFDVGATTLSGIKPNQPLGRLFDLLNINPELKKVDPGVIVKIDDQEIKRYSDKEKWKASASEIFDSQNQKSFWDYVYKTEELAWDFVNKNNSLPVRSFSDLIKISKVDNAKFVPLLPNIFRSVKSVISKHGISNTLFERYLSEQLLITTQNNLVDSPFITAAMGLAYPSDTYYPVGGMYKLAELILNSFSENGGKLKIRTKVNSIEKTSFGYVVTSEKGERFESKNVISNIPIWNMPQITEGRIAKYFTRKSEYFNFSWGAYTLNFGLASDKKLDSLYYQIHTDQQIPNCDARSFFVSFSSSEDRERAPEGFRAVTISVHTHVDRWRNISQETYELRKNETAEYILSQFNINFPELAESEKLHLLSGSPKTFEHYTNRYNGFVGGIPHSVKKNLLKMPPNSTPFKGLYMVGDTVFPGQGTPAVVLGALNIVEDILN